MAKIRYAKAPPCCPCLDKANEAVWTAPPDKAVEFKRLYKPKEKIPDDDYAARKYWMDAYEKCVKDRGLNPADYITEDDPQLEPGSLRKFCSPPAKETDLGTLEVLVIEEIKDKPPLKLPGAKVRVTWTGYITRQGITNQEGIARFDNLKGGVYSVNVWKETYKEKLSGAAVHAKETRQVVVKLTREIPGNLLVRVRGEQGLVQGADVEIRERLASTGNVYGQNRSGKTDKDGEVMFKSLRYATYMASGRKDKWPTDTKDGIVNKPGVSGPVELRLQSRKKFKIQITKARWVEFSAKIVKFIIGSFHFQIWDLEKGIIGMYKTFLVSKGAEITNEPPIPKGVETKKPGQWRSFEAPRIFRKKELTGNDFGGPAFMSVGTTGVEFDFPDGNFHRIHVDKIDIGETDEEFQIAGLSRTESLVTIKFKQSKVAP